MPCPNCASPSNQLTTKYKGNHKTFNKLSLAECSECRLVFAEPPPLANELDQYYQDYWKGEVAIVSPSTKRYYLAQAISRIHYLKTLLDFSSNFKVLDIGAGPGLFLQAMQHEGIQVSYSAVEPDVNQRKVLASNGSVSATYASIENIPSGRKFDLIVISHVLEHVTQPNQFIQSLTDLLDAGGSLFIEVPNQDYLYKSCFEPHLLFFNAASLENCLEKHGQVISLVSVGKPIQAINLVQAHPARNMRRTKELIKGLLYFLTPNYYRREIKKHQMGLVGGDRQWLRALLKT